MASKSADEEHATEKRSTKLYNPIIFLLGLLEANRQKAKSQTKVKLTYLPMTSQFLQTK